MHSPWYSAFLPNQNQVKSGVRLGLSALTAFAAQQGWIGTDTVDSIIGLTPMIASGVWSLIAHSQTGTIAAASSIAKSPSNPSSGILGITTTTEVANSPTFKDDPNVVAPWKL